MTLPAHTVDGAGPAAVVLLHGIGGGAAIWGGHARSLAEAGFRAVAVDLPGYGASRGIGSVDLDGFVAAVTALLDHLRRDGVRRCVLLGHSMGGMVAQEIVARTPHAVDALVLACTTASFGPAGGDWQSRFVAERLAPLDAGAGMAAVAARLVPTLVSPHAAPGAAAAAAAVMARVPEATYRRALQAIVAFDRRDALGRIAVPTLLVAGADDRTAPAAPMQRIAARIGGAECVVLAGAGHIANLEQPAAFDAAVLDFLRRRIASLDKQQEPPCTSPATPTR